MNLKSFGAFAALLAISVSAAIGQAKFSGIYNGSAVGGVKLKVALTKGGRALGLNADSEGFGDVLDPAKSTINAAGKLKGATPKGVSIDATISGTKLTGTLKEGKNTVRITAKRVFN